MTKVVSSCMKSENAQPPAMRTRLGVEEPDDKWSGQMDEQKQGRKGLSPGSMIGSHFNIVDQEKFASAIQLLKESLWDKGATLFSADNLITWNKNLSFLRDPFCYGILTDEHASLSEKSIIWRTYILLHFAEFACAVEGDFAEFGCYNGHTALQIVRKLDLGALGKRLYLYDLFEWKEGDAHTRHIGLDNPNMYEDVCERFCAFEFVRVIKGSVPGSFEQGFPEKIAFAHIDMNHPDPEVGALKAILPRLTRGGVVILDDYGWWGYSPQKVALDPIIREHGLKVLELPTGQGLLIR